MKTKKEKGSDEQNTPSPKRENKEQHSRSANDIKEKTGRTQPGNNAEEDKNLKQALPGKNKGEERNKQRKSLRSDTRNSPDHPDKQEETNIRKKIHSSPGNDVEPMK